MNSIFPIVVIVISYFLGNISPSILIGRAKGIDIRKEGSGNAGTTNTLRVIGKKAAVAVLLIDILKGVAAVLLGRYIGGQELAMYCGLAALGGIGAAPFIPVTPNMGDAYQMQGFITVVIGGMGSYGGAGVGALLLGMARAFGDFLALKFNMSPAIAEASTVIVMIIVLLVRPSGLFGKKE